MQNILTIYKFQFPFLDVKYEKIKTDTFIANIRDFLLYEETNPEIKKEIRNESHYTNIIFDFWKIEIIYYDNNDYFIPIFQLKLFLNNDNSSDFKEKIFHKIYNINMTMWKNDYIFDIDDSFLCHRKEDIITIWDLYENFKKLTINNVEDFVYNLDKKYIKENLERNYEIKYYLYYIIYLCYIFYYNSIELKKSREELNSIIWKSKFALYNWQIDFTNQRLSYLKDMNMVQFKKYFFMLEDFFSLFNIK